ncbi:MAG: hypothetical protein KatS3mg131_2215 [Candidatus Tectimicrobiota bacterium]|nr:MAG: hypothetical protein KatS3mg131_2215 [Candidatus Tectomicrobia bacterium]
MDALRFEQLPSLRQPYLFLTFAGWSDAAEVSTAAGRFLVEHLQAQRFAWIDPEEFYCFSELRPQALYNAAGEREIVWPGNEFFYSQQPALAHDIIIAVGVEPHLKWRTFVGLIVELIRRCQVYQTITLAALWADVLYSAPVAFSGSATDPQLAARLGLGSGSRYEGPTGMVGVLHDTLRRQGLPAASLWANMPYYITTTPNPIGILALVQRAMALVGLPAHFPQLEREARAFEARVARAIAKDPKVAAHVRELERRAARQQRQRPPERTVSGEELAEQFERFLREQRRGRQEE